MPEMDWTVKIGMATFVLLLAVGLVLFHVFFMPPPPQDDGTEEAGRATPEEPPR